MARPTDSSSLQDHGIKTLKLDQVYLGANVATSAGRCIALPTRSPSGRGVAKWVNTGIVGRTGRNLQRNSRGPCGQADKKNP